jgi:DNA phosphorothioation-dependent restriction protein DptG
VKAKEEGKPIPEFDPVIPKATSQVANIQPSEEVQQQWREKLEKLPEAERAAEEAALRADLEAKHTVARSWKELLESKKKEEKETKSSPGIADSIFAMLRGGK